MLTLPIVASRVCCCPFRAVDDTFPSVEVCETPSSCKHVVRLGSAVSVDFLYLRNNCPEAPKHDNPARNETPGFRELDKIPEPIDPLPT